MSGSPFGSLEPAELNWTFSGAGPERGVAAILAIGRPLSVSQKMRLTEPVGPPSPNSTYRSPPPGAVWRSTPPNQPVANGSAPQPPCGFGSTQLSAASTRSRRITPFA